MNHIVDICPLTKFEGILNYSTKQMMTVIWLFLCLFHIIEMNRISDYDIQLNAWPNLSRMLYARINVSLLLVTGECTEQPGDVVVSSLLSKQAREHPHII